jgi:hypothetical protein
MKALGGSSSVSCPHACVKLNASILLFRYEKGVGVSFFLLGRALQLR